jgi:hypothetical protein
MRTPACVRVGAHMSLPTLPHLFPAALSPRLSIFVTVTQRGEQGPITCEVIKTSVGDPLAAVQDEVRERSLP